MYFLVRHESGEMFVPESTKVNYRFLSRGLAANMVVWLFAVMATSYCTWCMAARRAQFSIAALLAITSAVAVHLTWWKRVTAFPDIPGQPEFKELFLSGPDAPPLSRLLHMPLPVAASVLFGTMCASFLVTIVVMRGTELAMRQMTRRSHLRGVLR